MIQHLVTTSEELSDDKTGPAGNRTNYTNLHEMNQELTTSEAHSADKAGPERNRNNPAELRRSNSQQLSSILQRLNKLEN